MKKLLFALYCLVATCYSEAAAATPCFDEFMRNLFRQAQTSGYATGEHMGYTVVLKKFPASYNNPACFIEVTMYSGATLASRNRVPCE